MSGELWAIIGVVVGAIIPGGIGLTQAMLQRKWSVGDREDAWNQEKRDRLFEAKRSTHTAFTQALYEAQGIMTRSLERDKPSATDLLAFDAAMERLTHMEAQLFIYASTEASEAALDALDALADVMDTRNPAPERERLRDHYHRTRAYYLHIEREDLGIKVEDDTTPRLPAVDPKQSP